MLLYFIDAGDEEKLSKSCTNLSTVPHIETPLSIDIKQKTIELYKNTTGNTSLC